MKKLSLFFLIQLVLSVSLIAQVSKSTIIKNGEVYYLSNELIIKLKYQPVCDSKGFVKLSTLLEKKLSFLDISEVKKNISDIKDVSILGLDRILSVKYNSQIDPFVASSKIKNIDDIEWVEPRFAYPVEFIPNDPNYSAQWNLTKIQANLAWDINRGDTNVVIGIVDTGVDWDHPDIMDNLFINWNENPTNGIDDDNNGYIDDYIGWDFGGLSGVPDNNPMEDRPDHGTHVAGIASAVTNNGIGVASIGYKCKLMCVKTTQDNYRDPTSGLPYIVFGYEGIIYAANNGAKIINCSWGGGGFSLYGRDAINFANSKGALVVAAAGNENSSSKHYPSDYNYVLSVASTDQGDMKSSFSNYGTSVDVSAPGSGIYSTWQNNTYSYASGTSMASPLAAGLAGLVKSRFPNYSPLQVGEQIRVNCDDIYNVNGSYIDMLGKGRINAYKSLNETNSKSVRAVLYYFSDVEGGNGNGVIEPGEIIYIGIKYMNYLQSVSGLTIQLESKTQYATVQNGFYNAGTIVAGDTFSNYSSRFSFTVSSSIPANTELSFKLIFSNGSSYNDFQYISVIGKPTYATQSGNDVSLTLTSKGNLGFNDYPNNLQGNGFSYLSTGNLMFEGGLIFATSSSKVSDCVRSSSQNVQSADFTVIQPVTLRYPGTFADVEGTAIFSDDAAGTNKIGIKTTMKTFSFTNSQYKNFIILRYNLENTSASTISNLYAGLFIDWDLTDGSDDVANYNSTSNFGYTYHFGSGFNYYIGTALLSSTNYGCYSILNPGGDGGFSIYDGFTDLEKWTSLSSGLTKAQAGAGDVSQVISAGPFTIPVSGNVNVAFVIAAANNLNELSSAITNARNLYPSIPSSVKEVSTSEIPLQYELMQNYPNPFNPTTKIRFSVPMVNGLTKQNVLLKVYNLLGDEVATLVNESLNAGNYETEFDAKNLPSGIYIIQLCTGEKLLTRKMSLIK